MNEYKRLDSTESEDIEKVNGEQGLQLIVKK